MSRSIPFGLASSVLGLFIAASSPGALIDPLDTTANFGGSFNGTTATANGDSTVTLTRTVGGVDAGIDWMIGGTAWLPLDAGHNQLQLQPVGPASTPGGYYSVSLLFFDGGGGFLGEPYWIADSQAVSLQVLPDVAAFAASQGITTATQWFVRFRVQPFDQAGAAFAFTDVSAIPEPASLALMVVGGALMLRTRR